MTLVSLLVKVSLVLGLAALLQAALARRSSAATRHLIWVLAMAGVVILPLIALAVPEWAPVHRTTPPGTATVASAPLLSPAADVPVAAALAAGRGVTVPWTLIFAAAYAAGAILLLIRLAAQHVWTRRIVRDATPVRGAAWLALLDECAASLGIRRGVSLWRSAADTMPMAAGVRRADIVIPASAETWSEDRRRAVLLHELAHIDRRDCLTQTLAAVASAVYWIHPGVWWIASRLRAERELACDDRVLAAGEDPREYAGHLLDLAYTLGRTSPPAVAVTMARTRDLEGRMLAALDDRRNRAVPPRTARLAGVAVLCAITVPVAAATIAPRVHAVAARDLRWAALRDDVQSAAAAPQQRPRFDVVSIKRVVVPYPPGRGGDFGARPGGRLSVVNNAVTNLITNAYGVPGYLLLGGPDWIRTDRYDLEARADGEPERAQIMLMLQTLLEERFQLRTHRETREVPAYILTVARGGARLHPSADCIGRDSTAPVPPLAPGAIVTRRCGNNRLTGETPPNMRWVGVSIDSGQIASTLSIYFRRPVVDRTGLTGTFDVDISLPPLQPAVGVDAGGADLGPSVFTVLQEQLGLRVEEGRGPAEVLVIDAIERPAEN